MLTIRFFSLQVPTGSGTQHLAPPVGEDATPIKSQQPVSPAGAPHDAAGPAAAGAHEGGFPGGSAASGQPPPRQDMAPFGHGGISTMPAVVCMSAHFPQVRPNSYLAELSELQVPCLGGMGGHHPSSLQRTSNIASICK